MSKTSMITMALLLSAVWLQAQNGGKAGSKTSELTTIEGCLQSSMGEYSVIDDTDTIHHLTGAANKLSHFVGHEVEITGKPGVRTIDTTSVGGASSAVEQPIFEVKSVKQVAATCKSAGN